MKNIKKYLTNISKNIKKNIEKGKQSFRNLSKIKYLQNKKRNIIVLTVLGIILLTFVLLRFVFVAALVNGWPVSRLNIVQGLEKQYGAQVLDNLVSRSLVYQEAKNLKINVTQEQIDTELKNIEDILQKQNVTLDQALASQGLGKNELIEQIKFQKTVEEVLTPRISITDEEIQNYFTQNKDYFEKGATAKSVEDQIKEQLYQEKLTEEYQVWIADLKAKAKINYFVNY